MRTFKALSLAALVYLPSVPGTIAALTLHKRENPAVLALPITKRSNDESLRKRSSDVVSTELINQHNIQYLVNITVGSPGQSVMLSIDTGSSDMWVNVPNSKYCEGDGAPCAEGGVFDPKKSSTYKKFDYDIKATYVAGMLAKGPYGTDKVEIGGVTVKKAEFAVADESHNDYGILGIGYKASTYASYALQREYANLPQALVDSGAIKSAAYSVWLNKVNNVGNLLFGGVNKAQYEGELQTLPIVPNRGKYTSLALAITGITYGNSKDTKSISQGLPLTASLDSGSTLIWLPKEMVDPILKSLDGAYSSLANAAHVPCEKAVTDFNVTFSLSGVKISIPVSDLVFSASNYKGVPANHCIFGISYGEPGVSLLGDTFLRSAYVVYDLDNNQISLAQARYNPGKDDIYEIGTGKDAVPGAKHVASAVSSATGNGVDPTNMPVTPGATGGISTMTQSTETGSSTGTVTQTAATGGSSTGNNSPASSTSSGLADLPTARSQFLLQGALGAGLLLAL
ncbi:aspartic-type endopeptidase opsB [Penicillium diatomitis]|uniref:Aspartic-type endopeptidase opsB n=1 Tax=Penicillium diatomitis TaxID=2819901 RepID=A0A9W9XBW0_9EURO|nr:aspartic-type endopeptidase opsB [Penicillium diatomitis]KAJ5488535.1 aspartic-type endopeptidase opsB [Penicillium diatomitis]